MVKVLREGVDLASETVRHECRVCRCLFDFDRSEGRAEPLLDGEALVIDCPGCGLEAWVEGLGRC